MPGCSQECTACHARLAQLHRWLNGTQVIDDKPLSSTMPLCLQDAFGFDAEQVQQQINDTRAQLLQVTQHADRLLCGNHAGAGWPMTRKVRLPPSMPYFTCQVRLNGHMHTFLFIVGHYRAVHLEAAARRSH